MLKQPPAVPGTTASAGPQVVGDFPLLSDDRWQAVRVCPDEVWHVELDAPVRGQRLVLRRLTFGELVDDAEAWVAAVDERNASIGRAHAGSRALDPALDHYALSSVSSRSLSVERSTW